jgi:hypothetical protein
VNAFDIPVILYHSINDGQKPYPLAKLSFFTKEFSAHLRYLRNAGFECITLSELLHRALHGRIGNSRLAVLTFDDGFLDNYLIAADILNEFKARGTIFVNPGHASNHRARSLEDEPEAWGFLNIEEMRLVEKSGTFEIQSHTFSHEDVFLTEKLIDFYTPDKFNLFYWLVWKLFPDIRSEWYGDVTRYNSVIPSGYPIFGYGRSLRGREFIPSPDFVDRSIQLFRSRGFESFEELQTYRDKGKYESEECYLQRVDTQIVYSKQILEQALSKSIECICFPGDIYSNFLLTRAQQAGYKVYIRPHWGKRTSNLNSLINAKQILGNNQMIGLQRVAFSSGYRGFLPIESAAYWIAKISVDTARGNSFYNNCFSTARFIKRKILRRESISRMHRNEN